MSKRGYLATFWDHVDKSGGPDACWPWLEYIGSHGYGSLQYEGKPTPAHRVAYALTHGKIDGRVVRHTCDNHPCVNPRHLIAGSHKDNTQDMMAKGRAKFWGGKVRRGSQTTRAKLIETDIPKIRQMIADKIPLTEIARQFKVWPTAISYIKHNKSWRHIK